MIRILIAAAALLAPAIAHAEDWRVVRINSEAGFVLSVDADSLLPGDEPGQRRVRILAVSAEGRGNFAALIGDLIYDCNGNRTRMVRVRGFDAGGEVLNDSGIQPWTEITPDTNYSLVNGLVCEGKPLAAQSLGSGLPIAEARALLD